MQIPKKIFKEWEKHYGYGDLKKATEKTGLNKFTISRAMNTGRCSDEVFDSLNDYFLQVAAEEKKRLDKASRRYASINDDNN